MNDRKYVLPSETRASVVIGLQSHTSQKWRLFLQDGPYWNYIARFVASKRYFKRDDTRIDDVVSTTIARVAKSLRECIKPVVKKPKKEPTPAPTTTNGGGCANGQCPNYQPGWRVFR